MIGLGITICNRLLAKSNSKPFSTVLSQTCGESIGSQAFASKDFISTRQSFGYGFLGA